MASGALKRHPLSPTIASAGSDGHAHGGPALQYRGQATLVLYMEEIASGSKSILGISYGAAYLVVNQVIRKPPISHDSLCYIQGWRLFFFPLSSFFHSLAYGRGNDHTKRCDHCSFYNLEYNDESPYSGCKERRITCTLVFYIERVLINSTQYPSYLSAR